MDFAVRVVYNAALTRASYGKYSVTQVGWKGDREYTKKQRLEWAKLLKGGR